MIYVLNGPDLDRLGEREPEIYGSTTLAEVEQMCRDVASSKGKEIEFRQTNELSELIDWVREACAAAEGVVINPAIFTHHALELREALASCSKPIIEVHISNIKAREPWRAHSVVSDVVRGSIIGLGVSGYPLAVEALIGEL